MDIYFLMMCFAGVGLIAVLPMPWLFGLSFKGDDQFLIWRLFGLSAMILFYFLGIIKSLTDYWILVFFFINLVQWLILAFMVFSENRHSRME